MKKKRQNGSPQPQNRVMQRLNINWEYSTGTGSGFPGTTPNQSNGFLAPPDKAMKRPNLSWE